MSSRDTSVLGTLAERIAATNRAAAFRPVPGRHVWLTGSNDPTAGLLVGWEKRADGWWGHVVICDTPGEPVLYAIAATRLRPQPPPP